VLAERDATAQFRKVLDPEGISGKFRVTVKGDVVYGSIIDYLNFKLEIDGSHNWNNWLKADFEEYLHQNAESLHKSIDQVGVSTQPGDGVIQPDVLIWHIAEGESNLTPMTTHEGFCYITQRCVGRSAVSDAVAKEAILCLSRYKVGDVSMHRELEENASTASPLEKAFVLGVKGAQGAQQEVPSNLCLIKKNALACKIGGVNGIISSNQSSSSFPNRASGKTLPEPHVSWRDLGAKLNEEPGARGLLESFLVSEAPNSKATERKAWAAKPPVRFVFLAKRALSSARMAIHTQDSDPTGDCTSSSHSKKRRIMEDQEATDDNGVTEDACADDLKGACADVTGDACADGPEDACADAPEAGPEDGPGDGCEDGDGLPKEERLKLKRLLREQGVWEGVLRAYLSDVSNRLLQLKCEETGGTFDSRRTIVVGEGLTVEAHCYHIDVDKDTALKAMAQTTCLYAKRVRDELRKAFKSLWSMTVPRQSWEMLLGELRVHFEQLNQPSEIAQRGL
jgi:hypothetical protein